MNYQSGQIGQNVFDRANQQTADRPMTRLEATKGALLSCVKYQDEINERLTALVNGLCGGHPASKESEQMPRSIPTGLADELDEVARNLSRRSNSGRKSSSLVCQRPSRKFVERRITR